MEIKQSWWLKLTSSNRRWLSMNFSDITKPSVNPLNPIFWILGATLFFSLHLQSRDWIVVSRKISWIRRVINPRAAAKRRCFIQPPAGDDARECPDHRWRLLRPGVNQRRISSIGDVTRRKPAVIAGVRHFMMNQTQSRRNSINGGRPRWISGVFRRPFWAYRRSRAI